jgi:hypothetical protein
MFLLIGLSNGFLGEWKKVEAGIQDLRHVMQQLLWPSSSDISIGCQGTPSTSQSQRDEDPYCHHHVPWLQIFDQVLSDSTRDATLQPKEEDACNPDKVKEYMLSSRFISPFHIEVNIIVYYYISYVTLLKLWGSMMSY